MKEKESNVVTTIREILSDAKLSRRSFVKASAILVFNASLCSRWEGCKDSGKSPFKSQLGSRLCQVSPFSAAGL